MEDKNFIVPVNFEEGISELEKIVEKIESSELSLEESIDLYERASFLSKWCSESLQVAEKKIQLLIPKADGSFELNDFDSSV